MAVTTLSAPALSTRMAGPAPRRRRGGNQGLAAWLLTITSIVIGLLMLLPIIWMLFTAFKPEADIVSYPPTLLPRELPVAHFVEVWERIPFARLYVTPILFAGAVTLISLLESDERRVRK